MTREGVPVRKFLTRTLFLLSGIVTGIAGLLLVPLHVAALLTIPIFLVGLPVLLFLVVPASRGLTALQRAWAGRITGRPIPRPYRPLRGGLFASAATVLGDPATWRDLCWLLLHGLFGSVAGLLMFQLVGGAVFALATPLMWAVTADHMAHSTFYGIPIDRPSGVVLAVVIGVAGGLLGWLLAHPLTVAVAGLARWLLAPTERSALARRAEELAASRAETLDARAAELRRIERDLHDGAQARLVSLAMSLGLAEEAVHTDPDTAEQLLAEARRSAGTALAELRELVRGIHPPVLADRGLTGGLQALALQAAVPVQTRIGAVDRLPAPLESALYFVAAEALTNIAKHSGATHATLRLERDGPVLRLSVSDNGRGGADPAKGTGLAGIQRRIAAFDGQMSLSSPPGGPTVVTVEVPCAS
jgi:signal transduction histidine kinase